VSKKRCDSRLGAELRAARKAAGITHADLAVWAGGSAPTVGQAERGRDRSDIYPRPADALGMEIAGRSLRK
jgi:transcriptional regulator with XRE-family HTH domain